MHILLYTPLLIHNSMKTRELIIANKISAITAKGLLIGVGTPRKKKFVNLQDLESCKIYKVWDSSWIIFLNLAIIAAWFRAWVSKCRVWWSKINIIDNLSSQSQMKEFIFNGFEIFPWKKYLDRSQSSSYPKFFKSCNFLNLANLASYFFMELKRTY